MGQVARAMRVLMDWLLQASWQAAFIVVVVLLLQWVFERRLPPRWRYALWVLVIARLVTPVVPGSCLSVYNLLSPGETQPVVVNVSVGEVSTFPVAAPSASATLLPPRVVHEPEPAWWSDWRLVAGVVWFGGAVALGIAILRSHMRLKRRIATSAVVRDGRMLDLLEQCKREMGVGRRVDLVMSDVVPSPALMGLWHARLLLPVGLPQSLTSGELRFIFLHELAHLKCRDIAVDWFLALLRMMHWFNPAIWLAMGRLRADRELARDAMVLSVIGCQEEQCYGQTILHLVEQLGRPETGLGAVGIADGQGQLKRRIRMIAQSRKNMTDGAILAAGLILVVACVMLTGRKAETKEHDAPMPPAAQSELSKQNVQAMNAVQVALDQRLPEVEFGDVPLADAIKALADMSKADIRVDWSRVEAAGVRRDKPVGARARDVKLSTALTEILDHAAGEDSKLAYTVADGGILVTTMAELYKNGPTREYPIGDFLVYAAVTSAPDPAYSAPGPGDADLLAVDRLAERAKLIITVIQETVDKESWTQGASIKKRGTSLLVTTTEENHRRIASLLSKLREARSVLIDVQVRLLDLDSDVLARLAEGENWAKPTPVEVSTTPTSAAQRAKTTVILNDQQVDRLLRALLKDSKTRNIAAPRLTACNGMQAVVAIGSNRPYISSITAAKDTDGKATYVREKSAVLEGLKFAVRPTISADRRYVVMDINAMLTSMKERGKATFPVDKDLHTEMPTTDISVLGLQVTVPDQGTLLLAGFNAQPQWDGEEAKNLLLLVTPTIVNKKPGETGQVDAAARPAK
ncbi:MAG TPA: M56 family metallopeptidase [Tepidisphaeraceae bacterium]|nr:M56 family metallopeptidase [Tepidisphaeraceae bacterium]